MTLTIAIPTYNRNHKLLKNIKNLLPQLTSGCKLLIIDNCSDTPVEETLQPLLSSYSDINVRVLRNKVNIGGNANILRCFEMCETPWLWVLGDDDEVLSNAVETIFRNITSHPDCVFFSFTLAPDGRQGTTLTQGRDEFLRRVDNFGWVLFISIGIFKLPAVLPNLRFGYQYAYSSAPHIAALVMSLDKDERCCFSEDRLIKHHSERVNVSNTDWSTHWSFIDVGLGQMTLLELPISHEARHNIADKIMNTGVQGHLHFTMQLVLEAIKASDSRDALYLYDQLCHRYYYFDKSLTRRLRILLYRLMVEYPKIGYKVLERWLNHTDGKAGSKEILDNRLLLDRFNRV